MLQPDEYHTGVDNSAYTNAAAATALRDAIQAAQVVGATAPSSWSTVADGLVRTMPFDSSLGVYDAYDGYDGEQIKQADVVMLTYPLDFPLASGVGLNDLEYYAPRTDLQGPAMTDAIHSIDASALNAPGCSAYTYMLRSFEPFLRPPFDQFAETRSGSQTGFNFLFQRRRSVHFRPHAGAVRAPRLPGRGRRGRPRRRRADRHRS